MEEKTTTIKKWEGGNGSAPAGALYGLGVIGAAIYFIQHATTLVAGLIGILKALVWPALVVYKLFQYFGF